MARQSSSMMRILFVGFLLLLVCPTAVVMAGNTATKVNSPDEGTALANEDKLPLWAQVAMAGSLICLSAMFAGLTIGIMGLDTLSLEIIAEGGSEPDAMYARKLLPVRKMGHQALSTLVLGNMWCNVMISQLGGDVEVEGSGGGIMGVVAFLATTSVILICTEIVPMSICKSSQALRIAAAGVPLLKVFIVLLYPVAKPLGMALDYMLHHDPGQIYDRNELKRLMVLHCEAHGDRSGLQNSELSMLLGAMAFHETVVGDIMTPLDQVVSVCETDVVDEVFLQRVWSQGHSRLPVTAPGEPNRFIGMLYSKDLILLASERGSRRRRGEPAVAPVLVRDVLLRTTHGRGLFTVSYNVRLPAMLKQFQKGMAHLVAVQRVVDLGTYTDGVYQSDTRHETVGIVTLEDVLEKLIGSKIYDEYDALQHTAFEDGLTLAGSRKKLPQPVSFFAFHLNPDLPPGTRPPLTDVELHAIAEYLRVSAECFVFWPVVSIVELLRVSGSTELWPTWEPVEALSGNAFNDGSFLTSPPGTVVSGRPAAGGVPGSALRRSGVGWVDGPSSAVSPCVPPPAATAGGFGASQAGVSTPTVPILQWPVPGASSTLVNASVACAESTAGTPLDVTFSGSMIARQVSEAGLAGTFSRHKSTSQMKAPTSLAARPAAEPLAVAAARGLPWPNQSFAGGVAAAAAAAALAATSGGEVRRQAHFPPGIPKEFCMYERGKKADHFTLIVVGCIALSVSREEFYGERRRMQFLAEGALTRKNWVSPFTAYVREPSLLIRISRTNYQLMMPQSPFPGMSANNSEGATAESNRSPAGEEDLNASGNGESYAAACLRASGNACLPDDERHTEVEDDLNGATLVSAAPGSRMVTSFGYFPGSSSATGSFVIPVVAAAAAAATR